MNCQHATLLIGADPYASSPELSEHLRECPSCVEFQREMLALEMNIRRALEVAPAAASAARGKAQVSDIREAARSASASRRPARPVRWRGWAVAASTVVAVIALLWALRPSDTLAHDLVVHVEHEPDSWNSTQPVELSSLAATLRKAGITDSNITAQQVTYVQTCFIRGHFVPHLVVRTVDGPVTVIVLPDEHVKSRETFNEGGYAGLIVPAEHGSLAILARGGASNIDDVARRTWFTVDSPPAPR